MLCPQKMELHHHLGGIYMKITMTESNAWARITAYMAETKLNTALEADIHQSMATEAKVENNGISMPQAQRLDCIYDEEPLGFEKDPLNETPKMQAQDPL